MPFNPVFSRALMKSVPIWMPRVEFCAVTHLIQADTCPKAKDTLPLLHISRQLG
jgi:hypothetical protein